MGQPVNTSQEIDAAIKAQMMHHTPAQEAGHSGALNVGSYTECAACGDLWPCQYIIQGAICLKLTAIAAILSADQATLIQGIVGNANDRKVQGFKRP